MKLVKLNKLFDIEYGNQLDLNKLTITKNGINFVSRSSKNLGVSAKVNELKNIKPYNKGLITVTLGGTYLLSSFVQFKNFYTAQNIKVLSPRIELTNNEKIYYCKCIEKNRHKYTSHGREANKTLDTLLVPSYESIPSWVNSIKTFDFDKLEKSIKTSNVSLNILKWKWFCINDIFDYFEKCKCSNASKFLEKGNEISYIGAKKKNNGVMKQVNKVDRLISKGNCICFISDGQGSVGYTTYQPNDFIGSTTLNIAYSKYLNPFVGIFLVTIFDLERPKYSFGRKNNIDRIKHTQVKLPVDKDGKPDWNFMEDYIKSLPYSSNLIES